MRRKFNELQTQTGFLTNSFSLPYIKGLVREVLLFALGEQPRRVNPASHFQLRELQLRGSLQQKAHIVLRNAWGAYKFDVFASKGNNMIDRCNATVHAADKFELERRVKEVKKLLRKHTFTVAELSAEYTAVFDHYDELKKNFS